MGQRGHHSRHHDELMGLLLAGHNKSGDQASRDAGSSAFTPLTGCWSVFPAREMAKAFLQKRAAPGSSREGTACQLVIEDCIAFLAKSGAHPGCPPTEAATGGGQAKTGKEAEPK